MQGLVSQSKIKEIEMVLARKGPDGESLKGNSFKEFNKSMIFQLTPGEAEILLNRLLLLDDFEHKPLNKKLYAILFIATVPAFLTAMIMLLTNATIPPWLQAAALVEIIMIESMIAYFSGKMSFMADTVTDQYSKIVELGSDMKKPLTELAQVFYEFRDILPLVVQMAKSVDKEQLKIDLQKMLDDYMRGKKLKPEEVLEIAKRIGKKD